MDCPKCGAKNVEGASFCRLCGGSLTASVREQAPEYDAGSRSQAVSGHPGGRMGYIPRVPNHLVWAIFSLVFFVPGGIAAVVYAARVDNLLARGDIAGAWSASGKSKILCIVSTVIFIVWAVLLVAVLALVLVMDMDLSFL